MKINVLKPADYTVSSAISLSYEPGEHSVPRQIGEALIFSGHAEMLAADDDQKSASTEE